MLIECGYCGAPIDVKPKARRAKCRYCGSIDDREKLRAIADETPKNFKAPRVWTPPSTASVGSSKPLAYRHDFTLGQRSAIVFVLVALMSVGSFLVHRRGWSVAPAKIEHLSPIGSRIDVAKRLGGEARKTEVDVPLNSDRYPQLTIRYADGTDPIPTSLWLELAKDRKPDPAERDHLARRLNGEVKENSDWSWDGAKVYVGSRGLGASVDEEAPFREPRVLALWSLLLGAAFDPTLAPTEDEMRRLLGGGYAVSDLLKIAPTTRIEQARAAVLAAFPGALVVAGNRFEATVPLDHPLFRLITLEWFFGAGDTLFDIHFDARETFPARIDSFARCLTGTLGAPRETIENPIEGTRSYVFRAGGTPVRVWHGLDFGRPRGTGAFPPPIEEDAWKAVVTSVDGCRD